jgi:hypothetical protein
MTVTPVFSAAGLGLLDDFLSFCFAVGSTGSASALTGLTSMPPLKTKAPNIFDILEFFATEILLGCSLNSKGIRGEMT